MVGCMAYSEDYHMQPNERSMMFGLSNAQAAATLAAVLIGHEIIMENGQRLLNDDVLNGTVVMILFTCIISSLVTERAAVVLPLTKVFRKKKAKRNCRNRFLFRLPILKRLRT